MAVSAPSKRKSLKKPTKRANYAPMYEKMKALRLKPKAKNTPVKMRLPVGQNMHDFQNRIRVAVNRCGIEPPANSRFATTVDGRFVLIYLEPLS